MNYSYLSTFVRATALVLLVFFSTSTVGGEAFAAGEQLKWQVVSGGGTNNGTSSSFKLSSTVGQTAAGPGASGTYKLNQGFWQNFSAAGVCFCGDADNNSMITISDAVYLITYIFAGGPAPNPICLGDADGNNLVSISDVVYLINYIFAGGPAPHCP